MPGVHAACSRGSDGGAGRSPTRSAARHRREQARALLADARSLVERAFAAPAQQLLARLPVAHQRRRRAACRPRPRRSRRACTRRRGRTRRRCAIAAVEVDLGAERAQVLLHRARRGAGGAGRAVQARADHAADPQRGGIDLDRARIEREARRPAARPRAAGRSGRGTTARRAAGWRPERAGGRA